MIQPPFLAVVVAAISLTAGTVFAGGTNDFGFSKVTGVHGQQDISRWDLNKNGKLDPDELDAYRRHALRERQEMYDARRKAAVEAQRVQKARAEIPRHIPPALLKQYDANNNGIIDPEEWARYREDLAKRKDAWERAHSVAPASTQPDSAAPKR